MIDNYYMKLALLEAQKAYEAGEVPIGAVIALNGEIVAKAHNMRETFKDATAHAEIIAIREACRALNRWRLTGATLYVTIEPCPMCAGAMVMSRISRLVYGAVDIKAGAVESLFNIGLNVSLNHQFEVTAGVKEDECRALMQRFFRQKRRG